jgi:hypothetical protein
VRLVRVLREDLLDCHTLTGRFVDSQPNHAESSTTQKSHSLKFFRKTLAEFAIFLSSQQSLDVKCTFFLSIPPKNLFVDDFDSFLSLFRRTRLICSARTRVQLLLPFDCYFEVCLFS